MRLLVVLFQIWALGAFGLTVLALSRFLFAPKFAPLFGRIQLAIFWPVAAVSRKGRQKFIEFYKLKEGE